MKNAFRSAFAAVALGLLTQAAALRAQVCDPLTPPSGLLSTAGTGGGVILQWNPVPGSVGVQIRAQLPSGAVLSRRLAGAEISSFAIPGALLEPGEYRWRVQAACSSTPPDFAPTPLSSIATFSISGGTEPCGAPLTDADGNTYSTVAIGTQCWMGENLRTRSYSNTEPLTGGLSAAAWGSAAEGAFASYGDSPANEATYGLLYNFRAVSDARGLCPDGWRVPTEPDWQELVAFLGGGASAGGALKSTGTLDAGTGLWQFPNTGASNASGFSGLPAGTRFVDGSYQQLGEFAYFWTATEISTVAAWIRVLDRLAADAPAALANKQAGFSVRCVRE